MRARPILFSAPMVRAIREGRKTQTRRIIKESHAVEALRTLGRDEAGNTLIEMKYRCPYGLPGDQLWVKETFFDTAPFSPAPLFQGRANPIAYRADDEFIGCHKWRPSIHMPRAASRILLEVTDVRFERLQNISEADAEAEGVDFLRHVPDADETLTARELYECLWEGINGAGSWDTNPLVWVITFKRITL